MPEDKSRDKSKDKSKTQKPARRKSSNKASRNIAAVVLILGIAFAAVFMYQYSQNSDLNIDLVAFFEGILVGKKEKEAPEVLTVCVDSELSDEVRVWISEWADGRSSNATQRELRIASDVLAQECDTAVSSKFSEGYDLVWKKYYVVVAPLNSPVSAITVSEIQSLLGGEPAAVSGREVELIVDESSADAVDRMLGMGIGVKVSADVAKDLSMDSYIGIVPFEALTPKLKEIPVDGVSLVRDQDVSNYSLVDTIWVREPDGGDLFSHLQSKLGGLNYFEDQVKTVVVTGTSVIGARKLNSMSAAKDDWLYPIRQIGPVLQEADIAHVSNEASFADECIQNDWTLVFCGPDESFESLTFAGIDVVGLTGNHILDAGEEYFLSTLDKFDAEGIEYFGGGRNLDEAYTPATLELGSLTVAFLGFNIIPPDSYFATAEEPGSAPLVMTDMQAAISSAKQAADFVFVDMQWGAEYERQPNEYQVEYGHAAIDAGADVVSGVHPHWVQPVEFYNDKLIFYGLGNFLFDQLWSEETREGTMVKHYFYGDKYLGFEVIPTYISDEYQPEIATGEQADRIKSYVLGNL